MANQTGDITSFNQQLNPLTGDIQFNPASWGLTMKDIEAASLNVKTAIYSGNINLTADFYQEVKALSEQKYNAIETNGSIVGNRMVLTEMVGKDPGLYMNNNRLGFWEGTDWKAYISNSGEMVLGGTSGLNYLHWNGSILKVRGDIEASTITASLALVGNIVRGGKTSYADDTAGYWLGLDATIPKLNIGNGSSYLKWNGSTLEVRGNIQASSATFNYAGSTSAGGVANDTAKVNGTESWIVQSGANKADVAIGGDYLYRKWLTSSSLSGIAGGVYPTTGVSIDNTGVRGFASGVETFNIRNDGTAYFRGSIYAATMSASTITGTTITGGTIQTGTSGQRIILDTSNSIKYYNPSGTYIGSIAANGGTVGLSQAIICDTNYGVAGNLSCNSTFYPTNIVPQNNESYNFGTSSYKWNNIYCKRIITGASGEIEFGATAYGGSAYVSDLAIRINGSVYYIPLYQ